VPPEHLSRAVAACEADPASLLHHYRHAIALRHAHPALMVGAQSGMRADGSVLRFVRTQGDEEIFCALNMSDAPSAVQLPAGDWVQFARQLKGAQLRTGGCVELAPWQPCLALKVV